MKIHSGFTLIELMIVIVVLAIILTLGVPSFRSIIQNNRATTIGNDLVSALQTARSEALKRRVDVTVCRRNAAGNACEGGADWSVGWLLCTGPCAAATDVVQLWEAPPGDPVVTGPAAGVAFRANGMATGTVQFTVLLPNCRGDQQRNIGVLQSGRVNLTRSACP